MSHEGETEAQRSIDSKKAAPATETNYTLISKTHGWRLDRRHENGAIVLEWRCPECWQKFKNRVPAAPRGPQPSSPSLTGPTKAPRKE